MSVRTHGARRGALVVLAIGLFSAGCATNSERPTAEITRARTLIDQAEKAGAQRYAALELDQARDKLQQADALAKDGKHQVARDRANEASADAELAMARTNSGEAERAADEVHKSTETLQRETERNATATPPN